MQKNESRRRTWVERMRALHRDIGFFVVGLTIIYSVSGIVLVYRTTDFLKVDTTVARRLPEKMDSDAVAKALKVREIKVVKAEGDVLYFNAGKSIKNGQYNQATGSVLYTEAQLPSFLNQWNQVHKASSSSVVHWFAAGYGILLLFLALSSFWMFKPGSAMLRRGVYLSCAGMGLAAVVVMLV